MCPGEQDICRRIPHLLKKKETLTLHPNCVLNSVQSLSCVWLFATPWQHARLPYPSPTPRACSNHWVIHPSHPLLFPSPPAFNHSQHQGLFQWVSSSHPVVKVLEFQLQHHSFQWLFRTDLFQDGLVWSPCSPGDSQESSPTLKFKSINS